MIGWTIRAATELAGSDSAFWVRLPAPLFHALTAILIIAVTARIEGRTEHEFAFIGAGFHSMNMMTMFGEDRPKELQLLFPLPPGRQA